MNFVRASWCARLWRKDRRGLARDRSRRLSHGRGVSPEGGTDGSNPVPSSGEMLWGGRRGNGNFVAASNRWSAPMPQPNDLSRSLVALDQDSTIIAVVEMSQ